MIFHQVLQLCLRRQLLRHSEHAYVLLPNALKEQLGLHFVATTEDENLLRAAARVIEHHRFTVSSQHGSMPGRADGAWAGMTHQQSGAYAISLKATDNI